MARDVTKRAARRHAPRLGRSVISADLIVIARRLIVPEGRMRVARHEVPGMASKDAIRPGGTG